MLVAVPIDPRAQGSLVDTQLASDFGGRPLGLDHHLHRLFAVFRSELTIFRHNDPSSSGEILPYWVTVRWEPHTPPDAISIGCGSPEGTGGLRNGVVGVAGLWSGGLSTDSDIRVIHAASE